MFSVVFCFIAGPVSAQEKTDLPPGIISKEPARTFKARVNKINASEKFFEALANQPDHGPVINLNLLPYRPRGNSEIIKEFGGEVILSVRAEMPDVSQEYWDHFVTFRYFSMEVLKNMYKSDRFHEANANRMKGLESTIAVFFKPMPLPE